MTVGELYVFPGVYRIDLKTKQVTSWHMPFHYSKNGTLWPRPIVGVNVSKMPEGEGVSTKWVHAKVAAATTN